MYSKKMLASAKLQIRTQIEDMPSPFDSNQFLTAFPKNHPEHYASFLESYQKRGDDLPHATQKANAMLMHTVSHCFGDITRKIADCPNPKGGNMSKWVKI